MQTPWQIKNELVGRVLAEFISHEILHDCETTEDVYEINLDDYWHDLKPHVIKKLEENWEDALKIISDDGGAEGGR
tara:strand:- start:202 stop:429 length:228 start_codon:yes stop_codon:yes gene_type:complete